MDLLFVIDNSSSMADKQALLEEAVPGLLHRLVNPLCLNTASGAQYEAADGSVACATGYHREFEPLMDMHVGVITTSIGAAGGNVCSTLDAKDDRAHLLGKLDRGAFIPTYQGSGFLDWDPLAQHLPPGESDIAEIEGRFTDMVSAAGENGCGLEETLESWYRFLIDPAPALATVLQGGVASPSGIDTELLAERAAFLRPDSLVAVIMLSDENDCSIIAHGQGWIVGNSGGQQMPRATSACDGDPNSACCRPCALFEASPPKGCAPLNQDSACQLSEFLSPAEDRIDLRCFHEQQRFGFDFLYPTARYAVGLRSRTLCPDSLYDDADCTCGAARERATRLGLPAPACSERQTGKSVPNPLFANLSGKPAFERDASQVFLAGIIGVPWQDIATPATLNDPSKLEYMTASDLARVDPMLGVNRWSVILGDLVTYSDPLDPFMREAEDPRAGTNPVTGDSTESAESLDPTASPINGHERLTGGGSLQYACTFPLATPRDCSTSDGTCDCADAKSTPSDPICQPPSGGVATTTQYYAKAYPGLRELDVLRQHGGNAVVASICPKSGTQDLGFGYRPALAGLVKRLHCADLNAAFDSDPSSLSYGTIDCRLIAVNSAPSACACDGVARVALPSSDRVALEIQLQSLGQCGGQTGVLCSQVCACEIPQALGADLSACQYDAASPPLNQETGEPVNGWCYVDPMDGFGASALVQDCPADNLKNLRLLGTGAPSGDERLYAVCGASCQ